MKAFLIGRRLTAAFGNEKSCENKLKCQIRRFIFHIYILKYCFEVKKNCSNLKQYFSSI